jgi:hypothetical protein
VEAPRLRKVAAGGFQYMLRERVSYSGCWLFFCFWFCNTVNTVGLEGRWDNVLVIVTVTSLLGAELESSAGTDKLVSSDCVYVFRCYT